MNSCMLFRFILLLLIFHLFVAALTVSVGSGAQKCMLRNVFNQRLFSAFYHDIEFLFLAILSTQQHKVFFFFFLHRLNFVVIFVAK